MRMSNVHFIAVIVNEIVIVNVPTVFEICTLK